MSLVIGKTPFWHASTADRFRVLRLWMGVCLLLCCSPGIALPETPHGSSQDAPVDALAEIFAGGPLESYHPASQREALEFVFRSLEWSGTPEIPAAEWPSRLKAAQKTLGIPQSGKFDLATRDGFGLESFENRPPSWAPYLGKWIKHVPDPEKVAKGEAKSEAFKIEGLGKEISPQVLHSNTLSVEFGIENGELTLVEYRKVFDQEDSTNLIKGDRIGGERKRLTYIFPKGGGGGYIWEEYVKGASYAREFTGTKLETPVNGLTTRYDPQMGCVFFWVAAGPTKLTKNPSGDVSVKDAAKKDRTFEYLFVYIPDRDILIPKDYVPWKIDKFQLDKDVRQVVDAILYLEKEGIETKPPYDPEYFERAKVTDRGN